MKKLIISSVFMLISLMGFTQTCAENFVAADANADGKLSIAEVSVIYPSLTVSEFTQHDFDQDGVWSLLEFAAYCEGL